jgi:hypothetical protein
MANEAALLEDAPVTTGGEVESAPEPTLRESIEAAVEEHAPEAESGEGKPLEPKSEDQRPAVDPAVAAKTPATPVTPEGKPATPQELKAPSQWKPQVREKWNQLPREVQEEVLRREADSMRLIGSVGQKIRFADEVNSHIQPFAERLSQNGIAPSSFIGDIFTSVKSLASGNPQEKAEVVANIVQSYGVDLRTLDAILTRRIQQPPEVLEARRQMARAQSIIYQQQTSVQQQTAAEAEKDITAFAADPKHEFFDDVRDMMADLVESGRANSLEDAYTAAIWANPDTRKILQQREAEARAAAKHQRAGAARRASSSVGGAPRVAGGPSALGQNMSLRETIAAAMDAQDAA